MAFDFPASPAINDEYTPAGGPTYKWDGIAWMVQSTSSAGIIISDTPPAGPAHGDQWWESDTGRMYIYYEDVDGGQWVQSNVGGGSAAAPLGPSFVQRQIITASGAITLHADTTCYQVEVQGGGGGGGDTGNHTGVLSASAGGGGGSGAYCSKWIIKAAGALSCIIGAISAAAGAGNTSSFTDGTNTLSAEGGVAGASGFPTSNFWCVQTSATIIASATGGDINMHGQNGGIGMAAASPAVTGGASAAGGAGGESRFGKAGIALALSGAVGMNGFGSNGLGFGAGGGGSIRILEAGSNPGSTGAPGVVIITEFR